LAIPLSLVARLEEFPRSAIESAGNQPVVQYRGGLLPLASLDSILAPGSRDTALDHDPAQVIVFQEGNHNVGIAVDQVLDIVEDSVQVRQAGSRSGLLGAAVVGKQVTDIVDLSGVLRQAFGDWSQASSVRSKIRLLLAESSPFVRGLLRVELEMAGYEVNEAANAAEALQTLDRSPIDVVLSSTGLAESDRLVEAAHRRAGGSRIPILALAPSAGPPQPGFDDCQPRFDRASMLRSIERLAASVGTKQNGLKEMAL
jgi:two-component system chemotaxis sensor kinase CheA